MSASLQLAENEELLSDGRILIRGTLRPDGTRRPDRYKKAGFLSDLQKKKYLTPGARRRLEQQQMQSQNRHQSQNPTMNGSNAINTRKLIQSVVTDIIRNTKSTPRKKRRVQIDFNEDVLQPLIHDVYGGDESALIQETTTILCRNRKQCQQWIDEGSLRSEVIKHLHSVLHSKRMDKSAINGHSQKDQSAAVRGKGTVSYGSGKLLSEQIEMKTNGHFTNSQDDEHKRDAEGNNTNGKELRNKSDLIDIHHSASLIDSQDKESRETKIKRLHRECREIKELQDRKANGDSLNEEQMARIDCKEDVLNMLMNLKLNVPK